KTPSAVALGYFDGVHLGHRAVINAACDYAKKENLCSGVFTFTFNGEASKKGFSIMPLKQREERIEKLGVDEYICLSFCDIKELSPEEFVKDFLQEKLCAKAVFCGNNYRFGKNAAGDIELLKTLCAKANIKVFVVEMAQYKNELISSTVIKTALTQGEIEKANAMLGMPYEINFEVVHGKAFGRTLGFPTINQPYPENILIPKNGVYITKTFINGKWYPSATGIGNRPTVGGENVSCETFIVDFNGDLYGDAPRVQFCKYFAPTVKFDSVDELKAYINNAASAAKKSFLQEKEI
ncbi:MAG: bifunctional riboflavin kinase/FAD synthetase, partial [Oscillospiraceae bacterium]